MDQKLLRGILLLFVLVGSTLAVQAQSNEAETVEKEQPVEIAILPKDRRHIITWNPPPLLFGKFSFGYEYAFRKNMSLKLAGGFLLPFLKIDQLRSDESSYRLEGDFGLAGFDLSPEFRFYLSNKKYGTGFYLAPYARLSGYRTSGDYLRIDEFTDQVTDEGSLEVSVGQFGFGFMIGTQSIARGGFVFNFFIGGGMAGSVVKANVNVDGWDLEDYQSAEQDFLDSVQDIEDDGDFGALDGSLDPEDFETYARADEAGFEVSVPLPVFRFGLAIGFSR